MITKRDRKEYNRQRYLANAENERAKSLAYYNANKEACQARHREYSKENREKMRELNRKYYEAHKEERRAYQREYNKRSENRTPEKRRAENLRKKYKLTPADFARMLAAQNGCCAICKSSDSKREGWPLAVDHCHKTGAVRGLLCHSCNTALGGFEDNFDALLAAARYIQDAHDII